MSPKPATTATLQSPFGMGEYSTTTLCSLPITFPAPMWKAPSYTNALTASTFKIVPDSLTPVVLASTVFSVLQTGQVYTTNAVMNFSTTAETQYIPCALESVAGSGVIAFYAEE